jgi:hypothetical protein
MRVVVLRCRAASSAAGFGAAIIDAVALASGMCCALRAAVIGPRSCDKRARPLRIDLRGEALQAIDLVRDLFEAEPRPSPGRGGCAGSAQVRRCHCGTACPDRSARLCVWIWWRAFVPPA